MHFTNFLFATTMDIFWMDTTELVEWLREKDLPEYVRERCQGEFETIVSRITELLC